MVALDKHIEDAAHLAGMPRRSRPSRRLERRRRRLAVLAMAASMATVIGMAGAHVIAVQSGTPSLLMQIAAALGAQGQNFLRWAGLAEAGGFCAIGDADAEPASAL